MITKSLNWLWNIRFLTGYRTLVAKTVLVGVTAYQWLATASALSAQLPDIPTSWYSAAVIYFGAKLEQFAKEHKPV